MLSLFLACLDKFLYGTIVQINSLLLTRNIYFEVRIINSFDVCMRI